MAITRSKAERFDRTYRSLRIYWPTRWRLLRAARVDRRAGLPMGLSPETTPVLRGLVTSNADVCERERTRLLTDLRPTEVRLGQLDAELHGLQRALEDRIVEAAQAAVEPTEAELISRRAGETELPDELIRQRRQTEHWRIADAARAAVAEAQRRLDAARVERARLTAERAQQLGIASSRALRHCDYTQRLAAIYRRALASRHPQREELVTRWQTDICPPPPWAVLDGAALDDVPSSRVNGVHA